MTNMITREKRITVNTWIEYWKIKQRPYIKDSTYATYMNVISNHILPYFGEMDLQEINANKNQEFIWYLSQNGRLDQQGGLSAKTIKDILVLWMSIINDAAKENYIHAITGKYKYPVAKRSERAKCLSSGQEHQLIQLLKQDMSLRNVGILLALSTGIRIGELCALRWAEINLESKTISITRTLQRIYLKNEEGGASKVIISTPKSDRSIRTIPISHNIAKLLKPYQNCNNAFFLTGMEEKYMEPRVYREYYNRLMNKYGMHYVSFHGLRHTFATRCIEAGCDYKTLSEILGHADVSTTMRLYVHSDLNKKREYMEKMQFLNDL